MKIEDVKSGMYVRYHPHGVDSGLGHNGIIYAVELVDLAGRVWLDRVMVSVMPDFLSELESGVEVPPPPCEHSWITTISGKQFDCLKPDTDSIDINDIAHHLSLNCRFNGAIDEHYSVAQHCCMVAGLVPERDQMWGLLHDASEAYISDIARPIKPHLANYKELEEGIMRVIAAKFDLPWPEPNSVRIADAVAYVTERRDLRKAVPFESWCEKIEPLSVKIIPMSAMWAEREFLRMYQYLTKRDCGRHFSS